jgi:hypothetical protein
MPKVSAGQPYAGRRPDCGVAVLTLDREALEILHHYATAKKHGALVSRLLYEFAARQRERARLKRVLEEEEPCAVT